MSRLRTMNVSRTAKWCKACGTWKNVEEFYKNKREACGFSCHCKSCQKARHAERNTKTKAKGGNLVKKGPKTCPKCKTEYERGEESFSKCMYKPDGLMNHCKACRSAYDAIYHTENTLRRAVCDANLKARTKHNDDNQLDLGEVEAKFKEMGDVCVFCGTDKKVGLDHDIPFAQGGLNVLNNVQPCCFPCNNSKNDKTSDEYREKLKGDN